MSDLSAENVEMVQVANPDNPKDVIWIPIDRECDCGCSLSLSDTDVDFFEIRIGDSYYKRV